MIRVSDHLSESTILPDLGARSREDVLKELVEALVREGVVGSGQELLRALWEREEIMTTGLGGGIAVPHAWAGEVTRVALVVGRAKDGVDFRALDDRPVHLVFLLATPDDDPWLHLQLLSRISRLMRSEDLKQRLLEAPGSEEIYAALVDADSSG